MFRTLAASLLMICCASIAFAQVHAERVRVDNYVMRSYVLKQVPPIYPEKARKAGVQGTVVLKVHVSKTGDIENIEMLSGHPMLVPAAIEAVKQWKYKPYLLNGEPVAVETQVSVNFTLSDKPAAEGEAGDIPGGAQPGQQGGIVGAVDSSKPLPPPPQRVRVSQGVESGLIAKKVPPIYPQTAKDAHIQGVVVLRVIVSKEGDVENIELVSGHPDLAPAAIEAVKQWKYKPYLLNQQPVEVETQVQVNFTLVG
jgi:TonB family protein